MGQDEEQALPEAAHSSTVSQRGSHPFFAARAFAVDAGPFNGGSRSRNKVRKDG